MPELQTDYKEGDTRMLLYAKHAGTAHSSVIIHTPGTDVFLTALSKFTDINVNLYLKTSMKSHFIIKDRVQLMGCDS